MRSVIADTMKGAEYEVVGEAGTGAEAVQKYRELRPDVVTMDMVMPGGGVLEAVRQIVEMDPRACVVMCSALGQEKVIAEALEAGAAAFTIKPFSGVKLLLEVEKALATVAERHDENHTGVDLSDSVTEAVREVCRLGSEHAATALSQLTGMRITLDVPAINVSCLGEIAHSFAEPDCRVVAVRMQMLGDLTGQIFFVMLEGDARVLCRRLLGRGDRSECPFGPLEESSFREAGNILAASFLNALGSSVGKTIVPSVPTTTIDRCRFLSAQEESDDAKDPVLVIETTFTFHAPQLSLRRPRGVFLLTVGSPSLEAVCAAVSVP